MARAGRVGLMLLCLALTALEGCGSGAPPPAASPSDSSSRDEATTKPADDDTSKPPAESAKAEATPKEASSAEDLSAILQRVIEDSELDQYLHLTLPGRFPLKMAGSDLPSGLSLTKGNQAVVIVEGAPTKKDAVLVVTSMEIGATEATIGYRYDVEGIRGTAHLKKGDRGWELKNSRIVEH